MSKAEQVRPLAMPSPGLSTLEDGHTRGADEGADKWRGSLRKRRCLLCCLGCSALVLVLLGVTVLVLALVFHIKNPSLDMNSVHVDGLSRVANGSAPASSSPVNVTLTADISMRNPNDASFSFGSSTVEFRDSAGRVVGVGATPAGRVGTDRSVRFNLTVVVQTTPEVAKSRAGRNGTTTTIIELTGHTEVGGTVKVLGMYKRHKTIVLDCSFDVDISLSDQLIEDPDCKSTTK